MNIRKLQYFISVAKNLHFTKAAGECYVAETVISRNIAVLEEEIGFKVFKRNNRSVELTPGGEAFYKEAKFIVDYYEKAVRDCQAIALGNDNILNIGFLSQFEKHKISEITQGYVELYPSIQLIIKQYTYNMIVEDLKNDTLDIVLFSPPYNIESLSGIEIERIFEEPHYVVMPKSHPLANQKRLTLSMIVNENLIVNYPKWEVPNISERNKKISREFGFKEEQIVPCYGGLEAALIMVELNQGIYLVTSSIKKMYADKLTVVEVDKNFPKFKIVVAYSKFNKKKSVQSFLDFINKKENIKSAK